jgi:coenzyme F420-reducing hydrogenase gamma subunit
MLELLDALLSGRRPNLPAASVCSECKANGTTCVVVAHGTPCLGPVTHGGCGALCPRYHRGCYGCFGPAETANVDALVRDLRARGADRDDLVRLLRTFNATAPAFAATSETLAGEDGAP